MVQLVDGGWVREEGGAQALEVMLRAERGDVGRKRDGSSRKRRRQQPRSANDVAAGMFDKPLDGARDLLRVERQGVLVRRMRPALEEVGMEDGASVRRKCSVSVARAKMGVGREPMEVRRQLLVFKLGDELGCAFPIHARLVNAPVLEMELLRSKRVHASSQSSSSTSKSSTASS